VRPHQVLLKGVEDPVTAYEVLGLTDSPGSSG